MNGFLLVAESAVGLRELMIRLIINILVKLSRKTKN